MTRPVRIAAAHEIPEGTRSCVEVGGREITVLRHGGRLFALWNRCPHANGPLGEGEIEGDAIVCPLHRWKFELATGRTDRDRRMQATVYPVRIEGDDVVVDLPD